MDTIPKFNSFFTIVVGYLMFNTVGTIVRIRQDMVAATFTISFFVFFIIFFWSVSVFQKFPQDSKKRERLKIPIWVLATALNLMFAYRVWTIVLPGMILGWFVWGMAGTASLVTFYFLFLYGDKKTYRSGKRDLADQVVPGKIQPDKLVTPRPFVGSPKPADKKKQRETAEDGRRSQGVTEREWRTWFAAATRPLCLAAATLACSPSPDTRFTISILTLQR